jgi:hypothetical protein
MGGPANEGDQRQASTGRVVVEGTARMPRGSWQRFGPGEQPDEVRAGDVIFRATNQHEMSIAISFVQFLRADTRRYAKWNHVMLVLDDAGKIAQVTGEGLCDGKLSALRDKTYTLVRFDCSDEDRAQVVAFAEDLLARDLTWGWVIAGSQLFSLLTGSRVVVGKLGTITCSGFAAEALLRTGAIFESPAALMSPADLAKAYGLPGVIRARHIPPALRRVYPALRRLGLRLGPGGSGRS